MSLEGIPHSKKGINVNELCLLSNRVTHLKAAIHYVSWVSLSCLAIAVNSEAFCILKEGLRTEAMLDVGQKIRVLY